MSNDITSQRAHEEGIHFEIKIQNNLALVVQNSLVLVLVCEQVLMCCGWSKVGSPTALLMPPMMRACKQAKLVISHCSHFAEEDYVLVSILVVVCIRSQNHVSKIQLSYETLGEKHFQRDLSFPK